MYYFKSKEELRLVNLSVWFVVFSTTTVFPNSFTLSCKCHLTPVRLYETVPDFNSSLYTRSRVRRL